MKIGIVGILSLLGGDPRKVARAVIHALQPQLARELFRAGFVRMSPAMIPVMAAQLKKAGAELSKTPPDFDGAASALGEVIGEVKLF